MSESAAGGTSNPAIGSVNAHSYIILVPYDPEKESAATVFDDSNCEGNSHVVWISSGSNSTGNKYEDISDSLSSFGDNRINSISMP